MTRLERKQRALSFKQKVAMARQGLSDFEIAPLMGKTRGTIQRRRKLLGLPPNPVRPGVMRRRYQRQMRRSDARSLAELRYRPRELRYADEE